MTAALTVELSRWGPQRALQNTVRARSVTTMVKKSTVRVPVNLPKRHMEYLLELVEEDLEENEQTHFMTKDEEDTAYSLIDNLKEGIERVREKKEELNRGKI